MGRARVASANQQGRGVWLWVAKPDVYLDTDGVDTESLDPENAEECEGWWTCHKETLQGDLALLWRTSPKCDIAYLMLARSDAYSIVGETDQPRWNYGCDYMPIYKFENPMGIMAVRNDPHLEQWSALRGRFQGSTFRIPEEIWMHLCRCLEHCNPGFKKTLIEFGSGDAFQKEIRLEEDIENHLEENLHLLKGHGFDLKLVERQAICAGSGGRIDLLCYDRGANGYVVIELKNVRASMHTFAQISSYLGWVDVNMSRKRRRARGLVIARGFDNRYLDAERTNGNIGHLSLEDIGLC